MAFGLLRWEQSTVPEGLKQLENLVGNSTNPKSYDFDMEWIFVPGANTQTIIIDPDEDVLKRMIDLANEAIERYNLKAIGTSCGMNGIIQRELAENINAPVFSSSLIQLPSIIPMLKSDEKVLVVTASKTYIKDEHFYSCGLDNLDNIEILGLEKIKNWQNIFNYPDQRVNLDLLEKEIVDLIESTVDENRKIKVVLLECTDLPPFSKEIRERTGLPVFDFISLANYMAKSFNLGG